MVDPITHDARIVPRSTAVLPRQSSSADMAARNKHIVKDGEKVPDVFMVNCMTETVILTHDKIVQN